MSITKANYVLVDFENVQRIDPQRFAGLPVTVVLFLGENQKNVSRDIFKHVVNNPGSITLVESIGSGKNALDFQISLYAGMLAERDPNCYIHFLSKDKGFDVLVEALRFQKRLAARADSFEELKLFKRVTLDATTNPSGLAAIVAEKFAKGTKPQKRSTLESSIRAILGTDVQTEAVINALVSEEYLAFDEKGRISYSEKITSLASIK